MDKSKSYLAAPEHRECYKRLRKYYDLDKTFFATYEKVYSLKRSRKGKDEDPSAGRDQGLQIGYATRSRRETMRNDDVEPKEKVASKRDWFTKPTQPQEPTDPD
ncbi:hypothetical protein Tco_1135044 [Tanacetum coccineum]